MHCINFNGTVLPANTPIVTAANRGLRYGDGVFETMKWTGNRIVFADDHFERLFHGLSVLQFNIPSHFSPGFFLDEIIKLLEHEKITSARLRLAVIRAEGGLTHINLDDPLFIIEASELPTPENSPSKLYTRLCVYTEARKTADILSPLKHNNYLPYCMAAMYARKNEFDDTIILNQYGRICETSIANIFFIDKKTIFTPRLNEGCIAGIIRKNLVETLPGLGFKIIETELDPEIIENMDSAFITNSIINLKAIASIGEKAFDVEPVLILKELIERKTQLFC